MYNIINKHQIFNAYKKLKHYYFYDNTSILMREELAKFEEEVFKDFNEPTQIKDVLNKRMKDYFQKFKDNDKSILNSIGIDLLPKKLKENRLDIITNNFKSDDNIEVERLNIYINAPIEIHIISVLWTMFVGRFLQTDINNCSYANKLDLDIDPNDNLPFENFKLFKPYFVQYQSWRDDAINKADSLLNEGKNVTILSLDIKEYYHNVKLDFSVIEEQSREKISKHFSKSEKKNNFLEIADLLNTILEKVHLLYFKQAKKYLPKRKHTDKNYPLPIGLISSGFLGNYYLKDFDELIVQEVNPAFYGRYVDDLMFVFSDLSQHIDNKLISPTLSFIDKHFVRREIFTLSSEDKVAKKILFDKGYYINLKSDAEKNINDTHLNSIIYSDNDTIFGALIKKLDVGFTSINNEKEFDFDYSKLKIQGGKVVLHYFDHKESRAVLNIFKNKLEEQRSEFRFLPDEDEISNQFDEEAFTLKYSDSVNKFRSIQDLSENKYGASKFLAKKIYAISFGRTNQDDETDRQILTFFKGSVAISFYTLWEKVITYYVIGSKTQLLLNFRRNILLAISKVSHLNYADEIKEKLKHYLDVAIATSLCLNPDIISTFEFMTDDEKNDFNGISGLIEKIKKANLYRTSLNTIPGINLTSKNRERFNVIEKDFNLLQDKNTKGVLKLDKYSCLLAPNYVPFHEINILQIFRTISGIMPQDDFFKTNNEINNIPNEAFINYHEVNFGWKKKKKSIESLQKKYFFIEVPKNEDKDRIFFPNVNSIVVHGDQSVSSEIDKKIAIANIKVSSGNIVKSILKKPNLSRERRKEIFTLLNQSDFLKSDITVFPEVSIPYSWLKLLSERSHKRYMGIIAGLEHWVNEYNVAFNLMATILPFKSNGYTTSLIKIRLKNHYSPNECELLSGYRLHIPEAKSVEEKNNMSYDFFHWQKVYFSVYNCFELANIQHRSIFKSKVDFIVASELNKDTNYFSDIAGAWVRDVHSYFIQVNTSNYGDSRLLQPAKSFKKDIIQVKGGINSTVLVDTMEINKLRSFQYMEYNLQNKMISTGESDFKPTPPDFDRLNVLKRMNNGKF